MNSLNKGIKFHLVIELYNKVLRIVTLLKVKNNQFVKTGHSTAHVFADKQKYLNSIEEVNK